eukprot:4074194-Ditylum_brightwellii.AAC.1
MPAESSYVQGRLALIEENAPKKEASVNIIADTSLLEESYEVQPEEGVSTEVSYMQGKSSVAFVENGEKPHGIIANMSKMEVESRELEMSSSAARDTDSKRSVMDDMSLCEESHKAQLEECASTINEVKSRRTRLKQKVKELKDQILQLNVLIESKDFEIRKLKAENVDTMEHLTEKISKLEEELADFKEMHCDKIMQQKEENDK